MNAIKIEDKLAVNKFDIDDDVHIRLRDEKCLDCEDHVCLYTCPAECFKRVEDHITFSFEGCLECGSCRIVCSTEALDWNLPRGGFGICYQYG
jgi:ferredoxin like protein